ncbi:MAG TPA: hypothetical protein VKQ08_07535 [Cyclobacteriaceae bacterium]|nr:hypothetical protein [Cyclobacteriaceae bacterium]
MNLKVGFPNQFCQEVNCYKLFENDPTLLDCHSVVKVDQLFTKKGAKKNRELESLQGLPGTIMYDTNLREKINEKKINKIDKKPFKN